MLSKIVCKTEGGRLWYLATWTVGRQTGVMPNEWNSQPLYESPLSLPNNEPSFLIIFVLRSLDEILQDGPWNFSTLHLLTYHYTHHCACGEISCKCRPSSPFTHTASDQTLEVAGDSLEKRLTFAESKVTNM